MSDSSSDDEYSNFEAYKKQRLKYMKKCIPTIPSSSDVPDKRVKLDEVENIDNSLVDDEEDDEYQTLSVVERLQKKSEKLKQVEKLKHGDEDDDKIELIEPDVVKKKATRAQTAERRKQIKNKKAIAAIQNKANKLMESIDKATKQDPELKEIEFPTHRDSLEVIEVPIEIERCSIKLTFIDPNNYLQVTDVFDMDRPLSDFISKYAPTLKIHEEEMTLYWNDTRCWPADTPRRLGFSNKQINDIEIFRIADPNVNTILVKWQTAQGKPLLRRIKKDVPFSVLKMEYCKEQNTDPKKCTLQFDGERIDESETPDALGMEDDDCVDVHSVK